MAEQRIKVYYGDQIRRFSVVKTTSFLELLSIFKQIIPQAFEREVNFSYQDEEKEWVVFSTDTEWNDIIKHCTVEVLYIQIKNSKEKPSTTIPIKKTRRKESNCWIIKRKKRRIKRYEKRN